MYMYRILKVLCKNLCLNQEFSFRELAHECPGYVGADLTALTREAAIIAVDRLLFMLLHSNYIIIIQ